MLLLVSKLAVTLPTVPNLVSKDDADPIKEADTIPISIALVSKLAVSKFKLVIETVFSRCS